MIDQTFPQIAMIENLDIQLSNDFEIIFPDGIPGNVYDSERLIVLHGAVKLPDFKISEHVIWYKGFPIPKIGFKDLTDKHFTIIVQCDKRWELFDAFVYWLQLSFDFNNSTRIPEALRDCDIEIKIPQDNKPYITRFFGFRKETANNLIFRFNGCKCVGLNISELDYKNGEPVTITATMQYFDFVVRDG